MARCRSCGARIIWARTESGRLMPVDFDPSPDGNVALRPASVAGNDNREWEAVVAGPLEPVEGCSNVRRVSHFSTCPQAAQHRRSR